MKTGLKKFVVKANESASWEYTLEVEAEDEDQAEEIALAILDIEGNKKKYLTTGDGFAVEVSDIEEVPL